MIFLPSYMTTLTFVEKMLLAHSNIINNNISSGDINSNIPYMSSSWSMSQVPSVSSEVLPSHVLRVMPQCAHLKWIEVWKLYMSTNISVCLSCFSSHSLLFFSRWSVSCLSRCAKMNVFAFRDPCPDSGMCIMVLNIFRFLLRKCLKVWCRQTAIMTYLVRLQWAECICCCVDIQSDDRVAGRAFMGLTYL